MKQNDSLSYYFCLDISVVLLRISYYLLTVVKIVIDIAYLKDYNLIINPSKGVFKMWDLDTDSGEYQTREKESLEKLVDRVAEDVVMNKERLSVEVNDIYYFSDNGEHHVNIVGLADLQIALDNAIEGWIDRRKESISYDRQCGKVVYDKHEERY